MKNDFQNKENPLSGLGLLISLNQMLYILIAMWVYAVMPEKMLMVYAIIFGAHLLPYGLAISIKNILCFFYFDTDYCIVAWDICSDIFCGGIYAYHRDNFL